MPLDLLTIRSKFPALRRLGTIFDNPGGTQVTQPVLDRKNTHLVEHNASHGGAYKTSLRKCTFGCTIYSYPFCNETGFGISPSRHIQHH